MCVTQYPCDSVSPVTSGTHWGVLEQPPCRQTLLRYLEPGQCTHFSSVILPSENTVTEQLGQSEKLTPGLMPTPAQQTQQAASSSQAAKATLHPSEHSGHCSFSETHQKRPWPKVQTISPALDDLTLEPTTSSKLPMSCLHPASLGPVLPCPVTLEETVPLKTC